MKILWIYKWDPDYHFDHWFHLDFVRNIRKFNPEHEIIAYGERVQEGYPDLAPIKYDRQKTLKQIHEQFAFDVVIVNTKSRCFDFYSPARYPYTEETRRGCNLPPDFAEYPTKRVMIEEDFHYETSADWYKEMNFCKVFQRHYQNMIRFLTMDPGISCDWLPMSVDETIFNYEPSRQRINRIAFAGSAVHEIYKERKAVIDILSPLKMLDNFESQKKEWDYVQCLQEYTSHLCGSSIYDITPAKIFEIMASGSILFTNESKDYGIQYLFEPNTYVTYKEDYSNVIEKAKFILDNPEMMKNIARNARTQILAFHTDQIRSKRLIEILSEL